MSPGVDEDLSGFSMADLFRVEVETQTHVLTAGLVELENASDVAPLLKELMRAAHSLKGAARIVNYEGAVRIAHTMEDCLVTAQADTEAVTSLRTDDLLHAVDMITRMSRVSEDAIAAWDLEHEGEIAECVERLVALPQVRHAPEFPVISEPSVSDSSVHPQSSVSEQEPEPPSPSVASSSAEPASSDRAVRISSDNMNRLLGLSGESLLASRWLETFAKDLLELKRLQQKVISTTDEIRYAAMEGADQSTTDALALDLQRRTRISHDFLLSRIDELDTFQRTFSYLSGRLYHEVLDCRMRPFGDVVQGFKRMVRDVARSLGKDVRLELVGLSTPIDRDILDRIEAPISHLLRNAVDHGIELPKQRIAAGKPPESRLKVEARHSAGMLLIQITDDGRGINYDSLREAVVEKKLAAEDFVQKLSEAELLEFLFLPGFTTKKSVTEISGRGVGLDAVLAMTREVGGSVRITSRPGRGTQSTLLLPLTLSVMRTLIVEISGEPYAFPLARIHSTTRPDAGEISYVEGRQHFFHQGHHVGIVLAQQALGLDVPLNVTGEVSIVVLEDRGKLFGVVVDKFLDERELVVLPLDPRLGKVSNISAAALMSDRSPVLIFDTEDLIRTVEALVTGERLTRVRADHTGEEARKKRVLVVDDSLTVRELERKLLSGLGYHVDVAIDGMDGWNAVRLGRYDLIVSDVDMPRMDGIELVTLIRADARLKTLPIVVVSYKDSAEDRQRGLAAGADHYLTKSSFQDETFAQAVRDLIGEAID